MDEVNFSSDHVPQGTTENQKTTKKKSLPKIYFLPDDFKATRTSQRVALTLNTISTLVLHHLKPGSRCDGGTV